ncbi:MAG: hypothetical protein IH960_14620, partial [Chloroflexi bacterium]|nr:hypothetical protein [Chloroflexota bacterium]
LGRLELDVVDGAGTAVIRLTNTISVVGAASVTVGANTLDVQISNPVLLYAPSSVDDGSFGGAAVSIEHVAVSFEVDLDVLPSSVGLSTTYSADPDELEAAVGSTFALTADSELAYFVSVQKSGLAKEDLGDNTVTMTVSLGWLDLMVSQGREIAITKISDTGEIFTETAQCERLADHAVCTVTFTGDAGGFSVFAIYGFVNPNPQQAPQPAATLVPSPAPTSIPSTATLVPEPSQIPSPTAEVVLSPTPVSFARAEIIGIVREDDDGGGVNMVVVIALTAVALVVGGSAIGIFSRRRGIPTMGLVIIAMSFGSYALIVEDSGIARADEDPDIRDLNAPLSADFDKYDFRYRNVGSEVRALSEAYRAGSFEERPEFSELNRIDPSIDVTIRFASSDNVDLELIRQTATVLNHVEDVVEARVPVRFAHQLSYIRGVLRVDRITPPQVSAVTSEGTTVHGSPGWNTLGLDGTGIKVGIIDVGFLGWSTISPSELPAPIGVRCYTSGSVFTSNLSDCETGDVHGTAVSEAVIDIAPAAELYISNPRTPLDLLAATQWMISQGVKIINHSVGWSWDGSGDGTSPFSDSPLNSVDLAVANGILWVNSAGNSAQKSWRGSWTDPNFDNVLDFASLLFLGDLLVDDLQNFSVSEKEDVFIQLRWDDSWSNPTTNLDLCVFQDLGIFGLIFIECSEELQNGEIGQLPKESISLF